VNASGVIDSEFKAAPATRFPIANGE